MNRLFKKQCVSKNVSQTYLRFKETNSIQKREQEMEAEAYKLATSSLKGRLIAPYQREGVLWMLSREFRNNIRGGFLCDEMGLGKTVQIIATILGNPGHKTLVVVPKSIVNQWSEEINKFAPQLKVHVYDGPNRKISQDIFDENDVVVSPYSLLIQPGKPKGHTTELHHFHWGRVVLDEGHEIRNKSSKIFASMKVLVSDIRWIISGTPVYNSMNDFVNLCGFIGISKNMVQGMVDRIRTTFVLRRTKQDVAEFNKRLELPPCDFQNVELEMYPEEAELYKAVYQKSQDTIREIFKKDNAGMHSMHVLECFLRTRQTMIWPQLYVDGMAKKMDEDPEPWMGKSRKMEKLFHLISEHPSEKSLIFCQFVEEMNHIEEELTEQGKIIYRIDGSVSQEERIQRLSEFKRDKTGCVFIIQIKAGGQGLNIQEATRVYITAPAWNPATEMQAIARSHRTGQTQKVTVRKLIYKGLAELPSIEESMMELQGHKAIICSEVLNDPRIAQQIPKGSNSVGIRDIKKIFQV
jgi:SNF2 family DNA or RNA helicase